MTARRHGYRTGSGFRVQCRRHGSRHLVAEGCPYCREDRLLQEIDELHGIQDPAADSVSKDDEPPQKR